MSYAPVISLLGWLISLFALAMLVPAGFALGYGEIRAMTVFSGTAAVTLFFGIGMVFATQGAKTELRRGGDFLLIVLAWPVLAVFGAVPFLLLDAAPTATDAFFEAMSGLTTTGATLMTGLDSQGHGILIWRAALQWIGGLGAIVLAVSILPMLEIGGMQVFHSAMPHGDHATITARAKRSGTTLSWVFAGLTLACTIALWSVGMPVFDAVAHALSTVSTGGFSTRDGSVMAFDSPAIENVLVLFMLLGAINFTVYWAVFNGRPRALIQDPEAQFLVVLAVTAVAIVVVVLSLQAGLHGAAAFRGAVFATVSIITTTGFIGPTVAPWPLILPILFLALMFIGGSSGSTAGGIKLLRLALVMRQGKRELDRLSHPHVVARISYAGHVVPERTLQALWSFFIVYIGAFFALSLVLSFFGLETEAAVAMAMATLTNCGAGLAMVGGLGADYMMLPDVAKWVVVAGMLLGRLELVAVIAVLTPMFWRR